MSSPWAPSSGSWDPGASTSPSDSSLSSYPESLYKPGGTDSTLGGTGSFGYSDLLTNGPGSPAAVSWDSSTAGSDHARSGGGSVGSGRATAERPEATMPVRPRQPRLVTVGLIALSLVVLLGGTALGVAYFSGDDSGLSSMLNLGGNSSAAKRTVSAPLDNRSTATFDLLAGVNSVHVKVGELGDDLYRISTPDDAGIRPSPVINGDDVQLRVTKDGDGTGGEIDVVLSAAVRWHLRFSGYAQEQVIDLCDGQVSAVEMVAGMHTAQLQLPTPSGTVPVKITGAVDALTVRSPADTPVRVKMGAGANSVVAGSRTLRKLAAGSTLTPKDWKAQANRYDVTATATIGSLNVENLSS